MKKMRKANVITVLALTVVMLAAMTGLASAGALVSGVVYESDGTTAVETASVNIYSDAAHTPPAIGTAITNNDGYYSVYCGTLTAGNWVYVTASKGEKSGGGSGEVLGYGSEPFTANVAVIIVAIGIPEFATIAIPVASILGLLFFFNHRKHKKE